MSSTGNNEPIDDRYNIYVPYNWANKQAVSSFSRSNNKNPISFTAVRTGVSAIGESYLQAVRIG